MPEPISIIAGVTTIVSNVYKVSRDVYELIDGIQNAPKHILAISQDVRGLYGVLGALQGLLQDLRVEHLPGNVITIFEGLQQPLDHCFWAFRELQIKICKYIKPTGDVKKTKWSGFRWQFTEKDTKLYRDHLASYKLTVDVALATANLANTSQTVLATHALEGQLQAMRLQLDALKEGDGDDTEFGGDAENGSQATDRQFALRRFLETAETVFTGSPPTSPVFEPSPKMENFTDVALKRHVPLARALWTHTAETALDLSFKKGDILAIFAESDDRWCPAKIYGRDEYGLVPENYLEPIKNSGTLPLAVLWGVNAMTGYIEVPKHKIFNFDKTVSNFLLSKSNKNEDDARVDWDLGTFSEESNSKFAIDHKNNTTEDIGIAVEAKEVANQSLESRNGVMSNSTGSFVVHGKKDSVITFGSEPQSNYITYEQYRRQKQAQTGEQPVLLCTAVAPLLDLPFESRGERGYYCPHGMSCEKGGIEGEKMKIFTKSSDFRSHLRKHEKIYKCGLPGCSNPKAYSQLDQLERRKYCWSHQRTWGRRPGDSESSALQDPTKLTDVETDTSSSEYSDTELEPGGLTQDEMTRMQQDRERYLNLSYSVGAFVPMSTVRHRAWVKLSQPATEGTYTADGEEFNFTRDEIDRWRKTEQGRQARIARITSRNGGTWTGWL